MNIAEIKAALEQAKNDAEDASRALGSANDDLEQAKQELNQIIEGTSDSNAESAVQQFQKVTEDVEQLQQQIASTCQQIETYAAGL